MDGQNPSANVQTDAAAIPVPQRAATHFRG